MGAISLSPTFSALLLPAILSPTISLIAQESSQSPSPSLLIGSQFREEDVSGWVDVIFVGEIEGARQPNDGARYKVLKIIKSPSGLLDSGQVYTCGFDGSPTQKLLKEGEQYIFFQYSRAGFSVKMTSATKSEIAKVEDLVHHPALTTQKASPTPAVKATHGLPGKSVKLEDAVAQAELIITGVLVEPGYAFPTGAGFASYEGTKFKVAKVIRGECGSEIRVRVVVQGMGEKREDQLTVGEEYVLLINTESDHRKRAFKILPATEGSIAAVTAALNAQPKK